ncbi:MAG: hypothetical protein ACHQ1G_00250, partial [Planctomycetota bacterium]
YVVTLKPAGGVEGRVTLEDGSPVPIRLYVECAPVGRAERSDIPPACKSFTDGTFRATLPAGRYLLAVGGDPWLVTEPVAVEVAAGSVTRAALVAKPGGMIEGRVPGGKGAQVLVSTPGNDKPLSSRFSGMSMNRRQGFAAILADETYKAGPLVPGRYVVTAVVYKPGSCGMRQIVEVAAGETARCDLAIVATGRLLVRGLKPGEEMALFFADGAPVSYEGVEFGQIAAHLGGKPTDKEVAHAAAHADAQGVWRRFELIPGTYRMVRAGEATSVEIRGGETASLDLSR